VLANAAVFVISSDADRGRPCLARVLVAIGVLLAVTLTIRGFAGAFGTQAELVRGHARTLVAALHRRGLLLDTIGLKYVWWSGSHALGGRDASVQKAAPKGWATPPIRGCLGMPEPA
jgi:hypothetical protein